MEDETFALTPALSPRRGRTFDRASQFSGALGTFNIQHPTSNIHKAGDETSPLQEKQSM
jgi:hypothetical protein